MSIPAGSHQLGPANGTLSVRTGRTGAAAKAGHNLLIHVTAWQATIEVGEDAADISIVLDVDATSLRVVEGTGGMQALGDDDKASIEQTIDDDVLERQDITFRSTAVDSVDDGSTLSVQGDLTLVGTTCPIAFEVTLSDDGRLSGSVVVKQTGWGITPYSTLFGALKVVDEVEVAIDANYRPADPGQAAERPEWSRPAGGARSRRLRPPSVSPRVSSVLWAAFFFLYLWLGLVVVGVSHRTALPCAVAVSSSAYLLIRQLGTGRHRPD